MKELVHMEPKMDILTSLKFARENGCHWDENNLCIYAAAHGYFDILKYARDNGCMNKLVYMLPEMDISTSLNTLEIMDAMLKWTCP